MSAIVKTEAVILRSMKYRESSLIVTLYTRRFGKISAIVKGALRSKSKYGSSLQPMSWVSVILYKKEGREIQTVSQCDGVKPFRYLSEDLEKMAVGMAMIELVNILAHEEEENVPLFRLLIDSLTALNDATKNPSNLLYKFEIELSRILGFQLTFKKCASCKVAVDSKHGLDKRMLFHLPKGGVLCGRCAAKAGQKVELSEFVVQTLDMISTAPHGDGVSEVEIDKTSKQEIENFLWQYLRYHASGMRSLKSNKVFSKIMAAT